MTYMDAEISDADDRNLTEQTWRWRDVYLVSYSDVKMTSACLKKMIYFISDSI